MKQVDPPATFKPVFVEAGKNSSEEKERSSSCAADALAVASGQDRLSDVTEGKDLKGAAVTRNHLLRSREPTAGDKRSGRHLGHGKGYIYDRVSFDKYD